MVGSLSSIHLFYKNQHNANNKINIRSNYQDSIHYWDSFVATIEIVKFLLSLRPTIRAL